MRLLLFSDLHRDLSEARSLVERADQVDVVVGAGDYATVRKGLSEIIQVLQDIDVPCVLVPGNSESDEELRSACQNWSSAHVLHGEAAEIGGISFFGLGAAVPITPFGDWSFDLDEDSATSLLEACTSGGVLVSHSPPRGHVDSDGSGRHLGSRAVLETVTRCQPALVVCGHVHASWGDESLIGDSPVINAGPAGRTFEVESEK